MRLLLDECVDESLRHSFPEHDCQTARYAGFTSLENGELLAAAEDAGFDVVITVDQGISYQQSIAGRRIAVIVICSRSIRYPDLLQYVPRCRASLETIQPGEMRLIGKE